MNISEVCGKLNTSPDTLRYYEKVGLIPPVKRNGGGIRNYDETDVKWIEFIVCMRAAGIPVEELVRYVNLYKKGNETVQERKKILVKQRDLLLLKIDELQKLAEKLNYKINNYEDAFLEKEKQMLGE